MLTIFYLGKNKPMSELLLSIFNRLSDDNIADYYQALYWYCHNNHEGQFSALYSILSTLQYKPSLSETSDSVNWETLNISITEENMLLLATALRLWYVVQREAGDDEDRVFVKLHYVEALDIYLAEYHDFNEDAEYSTYYAVYSVDESGTIIVENGSLEKVCQNLFGNSGKQTVKLFKSTNKDAWQWASAICEGNIDAVQKVLAMSVIIKYQVEAVDFLKSLPLQSRIRLLSATTFKYRGVCNPISDDHIRDTGYLWSNIQDKPNLGRIRCWFSVHETLAAAYVAELPDEELPISGEWQKVNGLCAVDSSWELEFPKRVATLKYYGQALRNCVGGYGNAIKTGRSVIFVVREQGVLTHCVEVTDGYVRQFYRSGNSEPDYAIKESVISALEQARLL